MNSNSHSDQGASVAICRACGYNLLGLDLDNVCPECGKSVRWSIDMLLVNADPAWVRRLGRGALLLVVALGMLGVSPFLLVFTAGALGAVSGSADVWALKFVGCTAGVLYLIAQGVVVVMAMIELTAAEPDSSATRASELARRCMIGVALCAPLSGVLFSIGVMWHDMHPGQGLDFTPVLWICASFGVAAIGGVLLLISVAACCLHMSRLAVRIPDKCLMVWSRRLGWITSRAAVSVFVLALAGWVAGLFVGRRGWNEFIFVATGLMTALIALGIAVGAAVLSVMFLIRFRDIMRSMDGVAGGREADSPEFPPARK